MKFFCLMAMWCCSVVTFAQGQLEIKKPVINLEQLVADDQPTVVTYHLKNTGNQPVLLTRMTPFSSLLKLEYDKSPILPGKAREVKVRFVSANMPEKFDYKILVYSNARNNRSELQLTGHVVDNPQKPELLYKHNMDGVKFKTTNINFNKVYTWQVASDTVAFYNTLKEPLTVGVQYKPAHVAVVAVPETVKPGEKGQLIVTYDAPKKNDYGYAYETLILSFNKARDFKHRLSISANLVEDFSRLSKKDLANAPVSEFDKKEVSFGEIGQGSKADCDFVLTNKGKSNLIVRKTRASCGCTAVTMGNNTIAPGQSTVIRATFDSTGKSGRQYKSITVITNDPKNPETILHINGNIKVKQ